jgi:hypothetical protein
LYPPISRRIFDNTPTKEPAFCGLFYCPFSGYAPGIELHAAPKTAYNIIDNTTPQKPAFAGFLVSNHPIAHRMNGQGVAGFSKSRTLTDIVRCCDNYTIQGASTPILITMF